MQNNTKKIKLMKFMITDKQYIEVIPEAIGQDDCEFCSRADIDYVDMEKNIKIRFGNNDADMFYGGFWNQNFIHDLINNKKPLDASLMLDLGFEWNQFYEGLIKNTDIFNKYHFVSNDHKQIRPYYNSWFYNDEHGNIIFEITPFYPFHYETKKSHPDFITYKQFMKDYKPTLKMIIPKERLIEWNEQAKLADPRCIDVVQKSEEK